MKLIFKNSSLVFQNSKYENPVNVVNNQYVTPASRIATANNYNIKVYKVEEGGQYQIKTSPTQWPSHGVDVPFYIVDSADRNNSNSSTVEAFEPHILQKVGVWGNNITSITLDFVANESGYLYLSECSTFGTFTLERI